MKVRYTRRAQGDLDVIFTYLDKRSPAGAHSVKTLIERRIGSLADFPLMAPETDEPGIRELTIVRYPYKIYTRSRATRSGSPTFETLAGGPGKGSERLLASSPHERSDMRDSARRLDPGYRFAHPGYACCHLTRCC